MALAAASQPESPTAYFCNGKTTTVRVANSPKTGTPCGVAAPDTTGAFAVSGADVGAAAVAVGAGVGFGAPPHAVSKTRLAEVNTVMCAGVLDRGDMASR